MARTFVACCDRCGTSRNGTRWSVSGGVPKHICPDGVVGGLGRYDLLDESTRPKLEGFEYHSDVTGLCPNCGKQLIVHAKGYPACLSCGTYGVETGVFQCPFNNWVHWKGHAGNALVGAAGCDREHISLVLLDPHGVYMGHFLTTAAAEARNLDARTRGVKLEPPKAHFLRCGKAIDDAIAEHTPGTSSSLECREDRYY